jgi:cell division protein FtsW (lipid II flippase)
MAAPRRNTELGLLLLGAIAIVGTYVLASLGTTASLPVNIVPFLGIVLALLLGAHVATRRLAPDADGTLLAIAGLLNGVGYVFIARLDEDLAGLQATWTALGIGAYVGTLLVVRNTRMLERYRYTFMLVGLGLLLLPLVPGIGQAKFGARIWVEIGPVSFQPGEFAKIALATFFAAYLVEKRELLAVASWRVGPLMLPDPKYFGPVLLAWGVSLLVMTAETDLGSSLLFFALFLVLLWVATERMTYFVVGTSLFAVGSWFAWSRFAHVQDRVTVWLNPWRPDLIRDEAYQPVQALYALADGGVIGTGPGLGTPDIIPAAPTDFIFAVIGEELGLAGAAAVIGAYLLLVGAGLRIAGRATNPFDKLLATGLSTLMGIQAFLIMGGVLRLLPLTGVTLPFLSYGGSSLLANYVLIALLVRISDQTTKRADADAAERRPATTRTRSAR